MTYTQPEPDTGCKYIPTLEQIEQAKRKIREEGFTNSVGTRFPPWKGYKKERTGGKKENQNRARGEAKEGRRQAQA